MSLNLVLETISFRDLCPALALHSFLVASGGAKIDRAQHRRTISTAGTERDAEDKEWLHRFIDSLSVGWVREGELALKRGLLTI
jgi:hypothetical protein